MGASKLSRLTVLLIASSALAAGCQKTQVIGAVNRCGSPVEVDAVRFAEGADRDPQWILLEPDERDGVRAFSEDANQAYVIVRRPDADAEVTHTLPLTELDDPPRSVDYDKEVELTGRLCPR